MSTSLTNCHLAPTSCSARGEHSSPSSQWAHISADQDMSISSSPRLSKGEYSYPKSFEIASRFAFEHSQARFTESENRRMSPQSGHCRMSPQSEHCRASSQSASYASTAQSSARNKRKFDGGIADYFKKVGRPGGVQNSSATKSARLPRDASLDDEVNSPSAYLSNGFSGHEQTELAHLIRQIIDATSAILQIIPRPLSNTCRLSESLLALRLKLLDSQVRKLETNFKGGEHRQIQIVLGDLKANR